MGNAIFSKRFDTNVENEDQSKKEKRIFPPHMYNGPLKLGDPYYRGMSKMEEDPMIPQRYEIRSLNLVLISAIFVLLYSVIRLNCIQCVSFVD